MSLSIQNGLAVSRLRRRAAATFRPTQGLLNRIAALLDAALVIAAALLFQTIGPAGWLSPSQAGVVGVIGAAALAAVLGPSGSYGPERRRRMSRAVFDILVGVGFSALMSRLLVWAFAPQVLHANSWLLLWTLAVVAALTLSRLIALLVGHLCGEAVWLRRRTAVVGAGGQAVMETLRVDRRFEALGVFNGEAGLTALRRLAEDEGVDLIVLAHPWSEPGVLFGLARELQWISADMVALIDDTEVLRGSRMLTEVAGRPALVLHRHPLKGAEALAKLALDYAVGTLALVLAAPLLAGVALLLKLAGGGPALFRQQRIGFNGRPFTIYKFRTMRVDPSDDGSLGAVKNDARCTRLGAFLRASSLDELPQLFNVLRGEMSIVGPRPHVPNMQVGPGAYAEVVRAYAARHQIKPGVTGWAQVNGMRGGIHSIDRAREGVELDLYYIRHWSLWLDLRIILATAFRVAGPAVF